MSSSIHLHGITWNHTRGFLPLVASAQRFEETHPGIRITWDKRSLQAFADAPLEVLAGEFDFLVIDHPHTGVAAALGFLLPLDEHLPASFLANQAAHQVGRSHDSYGYGGHQWALAIDAATPVASWNPAKLQGQRVPQTWDDVLSLAAGGSVVVPAIPIDSLMNWYSLCSDFDNSLFLTTDRLVDPHVGSAALGCLVQLVKACPQTCLERNPIAIYEALCDPGDPAAYCPFAYGYANYAQRGYAGSSLAFGSPPSAPSGRPLRTTLGGTGLAISARTANLEAAIAYALYVASPAVQSGLYVRSGGQPGHRTAWTDPVADAWANGYFHATIDVLDRAYHRPRYNGYMFFQDEASPVIHSALRGDLTPEDALEKMNKLYLESLRGNPLIERL